MAAPAEVDGKPRKNGGVGSKSGGVMKKWRGV